MQPNLLQSSERIFRNSERRDDRVFSWVLSTDMKMIEGSIGKGEHGPWQELFREILQNDKRGGERIPA